jgi:hypothetical protein
MNELPTSAIGVINQFATTQTQVDVFSDQVIQSVKEGEASALDVLIQLRAIEKATKRILSGIEDNILKEAEQYSEKSFDIHGNKLEKSEAGVVYDYSICADPIHDRRESEFNSAKDSLDERRSFLKALKEPMKVVDEETGELITIRPPLKKSTSIVKVSIR